MTADFSPTRVPGGGSRGRLVPAVIGIGLVVAIGIGLVVGRVAPSASEPTPSASSPVAVASPTPTETPEPVGPTPHPDPTCTDGVLHPLAGPPIRHPAPLEPTDLDVVATWATQQYAIAADLDGAIWTSGSGQVARWAPTTGQQTIWRFTDDPAFDASGMKAARQGGVWLFTARSIHWFDGRRFADVIEAPADVYDLSEGPDGSIWAATGLGTLRWDGSRWDGICGEADTRNAYRVEVGPDGTVWMANQDRETGTIARYDDVNGLWTIPLPGESNQNWVNALTVAPDGDVWISDGMRILHFDGKWEPVEGAGQDLSMVSTLSVDRDGTLWAAPMRVGDLVRGTGAGIARRAGSTWETFDVTDGLVGPDGIPLQVFGLATSGSDVFASTSDGLYRHDAGWIRVGPVLGGGPQPWVQRLVIDPDGTFWIATDRVWSFRDGVWADAGISGVSDLAGAAGTLAVATDHSVMARSGGAWSELEPITASAVAVGPDGRIWAVDGSQNGPPEPSGISSFTRKGSHWVRSPLKLPAEIVQVVSIAAGRAGTLWVRADAGAGPGIWRYRDGAWDPLPPTNAPGFQSWSRITVESDGELLVGLSPQASGTIVARLHGSRWTTFAVPRPETMEDPHDLATDRGGTTWVATNGLVSVHDGEVRSAFPGHWFGGVAIGPDGIAYLTGPSGIYRLKQPPGG